MNKEEIKMIQDSVDIPEFMSKPKQYYSIEKTEFDRMVTMNEFRNRLAFLNGLAVGATAMCILFVVAVVIFTVIHKGQLI